MIAKLKFEKRDCWIGLYWDRDWQGVLSLYICLFPTILIHLQITTKCESKGCKERGFECRYEAWSEKPDHHYCGTHSKEKGFCYGCGLFWSGFESFDFGPGYCSNCAPEFEENYY